MEINNSQTNIERIIMDRIINRTIYLWMLMSILVFFMQKNRAQIAGYEWVDILQSSLMLGVWLLVFLKNIIPQQIKAMLAALITLLLAYLGIYKFGLIAAGFLIIPMSGLIFALYFNSKTFVVFFVFNLMFLSFMGWGFISGHMVLGYDINTMMTNLAHWVIFISSSIVTVFFIGYSIIEYRNELRKVVLQLEEERKKFEILAHYDQLTGLASGTNIEKHVNHFLQNHKNGLYSAVLFLDIDNFKKINDKYGHDAGDECLKLLAKVIKHQTREGDNKAFRVGGDEMIVVVNNMSGTSAALALADRINKSLLHGFDYEKHHIKFTTSIGVAASKNNTDDFHLLKRKADKAMYKAKRSKEKQAVLYSS